MTGLIVTATGWTIRELDATPWPDVLDLLDYWVSNPPVHLLGKGYLGIEDVVPTTSGSGLDALKTLCKG